MPQQPAHTMHKPTTNAVVAFYEFLGTAILVSTICFVVTGGKPAFFIPLGLYVAITIGGPVSGGHFNPAVTLAVNLSGNDGTGDWGKAAIAYWLP